VETVAFLEALVGQLGRGWSARYGILAPYCVLGVTLRCDTGGTVEVVPSRVRGEVVTWTPFPFARGTPHYDLYVDGVIVRTAAVDEALAVLEGWRKARGPVAQVAARLAQVGARRAARRAELGGTRGASRTGAPRSKQVGPQPRAGAVRAGDAAACELLAIVRRSTGDARAGALGKLVAIAGPEHGPELARYLSDPERSVQRVAIDGVKRTGYTAAIPALAALVLEHDRRATSARSQLAVAAAAAMRVLSGQRGAAALTGYLTSDNPRVREAACVAFTLLANPGTKAARPMLERLLTDGDPRVERAARRALAPRG